MISVDIVIPYLVWAFFAIYNAYGGNKRCRPAKVGREIPVEYTYFQKKCSTVMDEERRVREEMMKRK